MFGLLKGGRACSLQIANADCSLGPRAQLQGSAVRLQIADCKCSVQRAGFSCFCKGNPGKKTTEHPRVGPALQIPDCKCRLHFCSTRRRGGLQGSKPHSTEFDSKMISVTATKG